ncbi:MAG TPA: FAD-dependent oxidoreductase [Stellaceae bacterium]|nr:FAD-dependent oxidoreductase [Stellaceae bacterium]
MRRKLVVVGNGMAGMRVVEELLRLAPDLYDITVFSGEPYGNYNRILLSPLLAGEARVDDILLQDDEWYRAHRITLFKGKPAVAIDRALREVRAADGTTARYDRLVLATGSLPIIPPIPGAHLEGVIGFRDIGDVRRMLAAARRYEYAVVIGGGLLGLEAAHGLMRRGMTVRVVQLMPTLMEQQLDADAGGLLRRSLEARGLSFIMPAETVEICGNERVTDVRLRDGREIPADLVVVAVGIRPNIALARAVGLHCRRGIVVDSTMLSFDPSIYAVGECAESHGRTYGLVAPLYEQAKVCANHLAGWGCARYPGSLAAASLKVTGVELFSAGNVAGSEDSESIVLHDPSRGVYRKLILRDNRLAGAVLYGDTADSAWYARLMRDRADVSEFRDRLMFGPLSPEASAPRAVA